MTTQNKLRLPKAFAEKWFEALESGKYKQGVEFLRIHSWDDNENDFTDCKHCCLGVAAEIIENKPYSIEDCNFIGNDDYDSYALKEWKKAGYPEELVYERDEEGVYNKVPGLLSSLNDGVSVAVVKSLFKEITGTEPIIPTSFLGRVSTELTARSFTFKEIVEFIKTNFELYEKR